jgi:hypothetical protein
MFSRVRLLQGTRMTNTLYRKTENPRTTFLRNPALGHCDELPLFWSSRSMPSIPCPTLTEAHNSLHVSGSVPRRVVETLGPYGPQKRPPTPLLSICGVMSSVASYTALRAALLFQNDTKSSWSSSVTLGSHRLNASRIHDPQLSFPGE